MLVDFIPMFIMVALAGGMAFSLLKGADLLGPRRRNLIKQAAYESGMDPVGTAHERYSVKFYLVAMIFIVFDVEVVFMYPWAVTFQQFVEAGVAGGVLAVICFFILILAVGLLYDIKKGGLEFD